MITNNNLGSGRELRQAQANLKILPPKSKVCVPGQQLTIGDIHGNAMKLLYFLIAEGVLTLADDPEQQQKLYQELYGIYETGMVHKTKTRITISRPSQEQVERFSTILANAKIAAGAKNAVVRLIGDDLVDRGGNDYLTMLVMHKIQMDKNLSLRVIMSNHAACGVEIYKMLATSKSYLDFQTKFKAKTHREFMVDISGSGNAVMNAGLDFNHQCSSMHGLFSLLEDEDIKFKHVQALYASYEQSLRLIDYSINAEGKLLIYTHAPVDFTDIKKLAIHYKVLKIVAENIEDIVRLIEAINTEFQKKLASSDEMVKEVAPGTSVYDFIWMRRSHHGHYHVPPNTTFVHGHDGVGKSPAGLINLDDSQIGKFDIVDGELPVLITRDE